MTTSAQVSVDGTAIIIVPQSQVFQKVYLHATGTIWIGAAGVTSATGYKMDNGDKLEIELSADQDLYAIGNGGTTSTLFVLATDA